MTQRQVIVRDAGHQALDTLDATDIPDLSAAYDAAGAAAAAQSAAIAAAASDATTKANAAAAASAPTTRTITAGTGLTGGGTLAADRTLAADFGTAVGKVTQGNDARLSDARTPTAHAASHAAAASDPVTLGQSQVTGLGTMASLNNPMTTAADLIVGGTSGALARLAKGSDGQVLTVDPSTHLLVFATPAAAATRASLGLATSDTPQFTGIEVGAASDTTLDRASAGVLQVEGKRLFAVDGTDIPVADGGTGASTALAARANLGAASSAIRGLLPTGALYHTFDRQDSAVNLGLLATGRLSILMIEMDAGVTINSITFVSGTTALSVGVNQWFALFDSSRAKLAVTVDDTSTAWIANKDKTLNLSAPFLTTYTGIYFLGIMVKATTVPSLIVANAHATLAAVVLPITGGNSTTGLTDPASCPNPAGAIAGGVGFPYAYVS